MSWIDEPLLVEILLHLGVSGPAKSVAACAQVSQQWLAAASDERVWAYVYGRLFNTKVSISEGHGSTAVPWRGICRRRLQAAGLINSLRAPLPALPGGQRPVHSRVLEGALDPMRGTHDVALASPQTRRVASFVYEDDEADDLSMMMQHLGMFGNDNSACMVASERPLSALPGLEALTGRKVAYFECRFRGGGSIGILGPEVFQLSSGRMHLGWQGPSIGYHSDDGGIYRLYESYPDAHYTVTEYAQPFGSDTHAGDVVGCALDLDRHNLSFFLNGVHLGRACDNVPGAVHSCNEASDGVSQNEQRSDKHLVALNETAQLGSTVEQDHPWCPAFSLHEGGDQADVTMGLGGFFSGDMEMKLVSDQQLLDKI